MDEIARVYGLLGRAIDCRRALQKPISFGYISYPSMERDSFLDPVRQDQGISSLLADARARYEAMRQQLPASKREEVTT